MHQVAIKCPVKYQSNRVPLGSFWEVNGLPHPLVDVWHARISSGKIVEELLPSDFLISWMDEHTPSWSYFYSDLNVGKAKTYGLYPESTFLKFHDPQLVIGFENTSDAVLFKLTWT